MFQTHYLIQLDVMYRNGQLTAGTKEFIEMLNRQGISYTILTEQSGKTREQIVSMLADAGLYEIRIEEIYTSAMAAVDYAYHYAKKRRACVYGGKGITSLLQKTGFEFDYIAPEFLFVGLDTQLSYEEYSDALEMLFDGTVMLATDSRKTVLSDGRSRIGSAAIVSMLETASGTEALHFGRGSRLLWQWLLKYIRKTAADVTAVGNHFEKDIISAADLGIRTVYVADDDAGAEALMSSRIHPDYIIENLAGLTR